MKSKTDSTKVLQASGTGGGRPMVSGFYWNSCVSRTKEVKMLTVSQHPIETLILFFSFHLRSDNTLNWLFLSETFEVFIV